MGKIWLQANAGERGNYTETKQGVQPLVCYPLVPKILEPTRTMVVPSSMATG